MGSAKAGDKGFGPPLRRATRVFPEIGPGVAALKCDSSDRDYVLAKPATTILIYDSNGNLTGRIPNANSQGATIKYAVDMDLSPDGLLLVADRGANAVEIFKTDGSLVARVPVNAPTSIAALSNGQFAVTSTYVRPAGASKRRNRQAGAKLRRSN